MSTAGSSPLSTHVIATAGHVDHGKSALVRALTGMEPDRFAEERRRGMTIDLGYAWTTLPSGRQVAFVDVPGHQRFIANMLAGLGPAPAVLFVVAADEGWSRQSSEHLAAIHALGVRHGLLVVTHSDRAEPGPVLVDGLARLRATSLGEVEAVVASGSTGAGIDLLVTALDRLVSRLPDADVSAPVRLWLDRSFTIRGAGTVVTGTLSAGYVALSSHLTLRNHAVTVRGIQATGVQRDSMNAVGRVALNLRGVGADEVGRGDVLLTPDTFSVTSTVDARLTPPQLHSGRFVLHVGTAAVQVRVRLLGSEGAARLTLARPLPLRAGDRAVLRDPGRQEVAAGVLILDGDPPALQRRGAPLARAAALAAATGTPDPVAEVRRRGAVTRVHLDRLGVDTSALSDVHGWLVDPHYRDAKLGEIPTAADEWARTHPLEPAMPREALRRVLDVPAALLDDLVADSGLTLRDGLIGRPGTAPALGRAEAGLALLLDRLADTPFAAPERDDLVELGLGARELAVAVRAGRLLRIADGIVLLADAPERATHLLAALPQPFTLSQARQALGTTRRVAVPLLEYLDATRVTERVTPVTRRLRSFPAGPVTSTGQS